MSVSKIIAFSVIILGSALILLNWPKSKPVEIPKVDDIPTVQVESIDIDEPVAEEPKEPPSFQENSTPLVPTSSDECLPKDVDRMSQLFQPFPPLLPIVETVSFASKVPWLTGRAAYLGDYASHYQTSKHFISRSLKGVGNYLSEAVSYGDRFNVLRKDKEIEFHLVLDLSRLKLWTYYYDATENERVLLKIYPVCVGRLDSKKASGCLTPMGVFSLGNDIAVYKPGILGTWRNEKKEMISIFGVRWIPLGKELSNCTGSCKGLGLHGVPWKFNPETQDYKENQECIGRYESGGCIRLLTEDIEELFAVVVSRPSYLHIVKDFHDAVLPGKEIN